MWCAPVQNVAHRQIQELIRAVALDDLRHGQAVLGGDALAQLERVGVRVAMHVVQRRTRGGQRLRARAERVLVRRELDGIRDAELTRQLLDRLASFVRGEATRSTVRPGVTCERKSNLPCQQSLASSANCRRPDPAPFVSKQRGWAIAIRTAPRGSHRSRRRRLADLNRQNANEELPEAQPTRALDATREDFPASASRDDLRDLNDLLDASEPLQSPTGRVFGVWR